MALDKWKAQGALSTVGAAALLGQSNNAIDNFVRHGQDSANYFRDNNIADHKRQVADANAGLVTELMEANKLSDPLQREAAYAAARANMSPLADATKANEAFLTAGKNYKTDRLNQLNLDQANRTTAIQGRVDTGTAFMQEQIAANNGVYDPGKIAEAWAAKGGTPDGLRRVGDTFKHNSGMNAAAAAAKDNLIQRNWQSTHNLAQDKFANTRQNQLDNLRFKVAESKEQAYQTKRTEARAATDSWVSSIGSKLIGWDEDAQQNAKGWIDLARSHNVPEKDIIRALDKNSTTNFFKERILSDNGPADLKTFIGDYVADRSPIENFQFGMQQRNNGGATNIGPTAKEIYSGNTNTPKVTSKPSEVSPIQQEIANIAKQTGIDLSKPGSNISVNTPEPKSAPAETPVAPEVNSPEFEALSNEDKLRAYEQAYYGPKFRPTNRIAYSDKNILDYTVNDVADSAGILGNNVVDGAATFATTLKNKQYYDNNILPNKPVSDIAIRDLPMIGLRAGGAALDIGEQLAKMPITVANVIAGEQGFPLIGDTTSIANEPVAEQTKQSEKQARQIEDIMRQSLASMAAPDEQDLSFIDRLPKPDATIFQEAIARGDMVPAGQSPRPSLQQIAQQGFGLNPGARAPSGRSGAPAEADIASSPMQTKLIKSAAKKLQQAETVNGHKPALSTLIDAVESRVYQAVQNGTIRNTNESIMAYINRMNLQFTKALINNR